MRWLCSAKVCSVWEHRTVSGAPGWLERTGRSRGFTSDVRYNSPDCPVSQRSAGPTVGCAICAGHVAKPTARRGHRTVRCAPDMSGAPTALWLPTVGFTVEGKKSGTGHCPVCTRLSGAPDDRRQELPSQIALNGS
jgi:hypothetical protein